MRLTAFFKLYKICILLHRCNLKIFTKSRFEKLSNFCENSAKILQMSQNLNLQNFAKFQKFQLDDLVDFEKCCKTCIFLQKSVPVQPKTSNILPKFCQKLATVVRYRPARSFAGQSTPGECGCHGIRQTLQGSFSAASKRNFARKYALESSRRDLHNALLCTALI